MNERLCVYICTAPFIQLPLGHIAKSLMPMDIIEWHNQQQESETNKHLQIGMSGCSKNVSFKT